MVGVTADNLAVNDGPLTPENAAFLRPSEPTLPMEELRKRYEEDGYLFLKQILPRADVLEARDQYFSFLQSTGVLKPGTAPVEGIFDPAKSHLEYPGIGAAHASGNGKPGGEKAAQFVDLALEAHYKEWYAEKFCNHPALYNFIATWSGWGKIRLVCVARCLGIIFLDRSRLAFITIRSSFDMVIPPASPLGSP
jgi:phytanoyl-CoA hydroxylase